jgi:hypothetical protein
MNNYNAILLINFAVIVISQIRGERSGNIVDKFCNKAVIIPLGTHNSICINIIDLFQTSRFMKTSILASSHTIAKK